MSNASKRIYDMETQLLKQVLSLIMKGTKDDIDVAKWKLEKLREMGKLEKLTSDIIKKDINEAVKIAKQEIEEQGKEAVNIIDNDVKSILSKELPPKATPQLKTIWNNYEVATSKEMYRLGAKLLKNCDDMYIDIVEDSTRLVISGGQTLRDAIRETSTKWINEGFKQNKDAKDRQWTPEGYTQMVVRSGIRQTVTDTQFQRMSELEIDLVEISSHMGARPNCEPYQGRIYSLSGNDPDYPSFSETSYGEIDGLFGINCGHRMYPYIKGTTKTYDIFPKKENDKSYENSQKQRYLERQIRQQKREIECKKITGKDYSNNEKNILNYGSKIEELGRTRRFDREEIYTKEGVK